MAVACLLLGVSPCVWFVLYPNLEAVLLLDPVPRSVRVGVDPTLSASGALHLGVNPPPPGSELDRIEVALEKLDGGRLRVAIHGSRGESRATNDELWFDLSGSGAPTVRAKSWCGDAATPHHWPMYGLTGRVSVNASSPLGRTDAVESPFVFEYELNGEVAGSDAVQHGKVALNLGTLR